MNPASGFKCPRVRLPDDDHPGGRTEELETALRIAAEAHAGQKDRYGRPQILHALRVMACMQTDAQRAAAVLHDVVEDTDWSLERLKKAGVSRRVAEAVDRLTRRPGEPYEAYIGRLASDMLAVRVKLADLEDNMNIRRMDRVSEEDQSRLQRYLKAWKYLQEKQASGSR